MIYYRDINNINKTTIQNEQAFIKKLHTLQKNKKNNLLNCLNYR